MDHAEYAKYVYKIKPHARSIKNTFVETEKEQTDSPANNDNNGSSENDDVISSNIEKNENGIAALSIAAVEAKEEKRKWMKIK